MKTPLKWLKDYTDIGLDIAEFSRRMIMAGFEVEEILTPAAEISNVVVGRILKIERHPNADKLVVCSVDVGGERPLQIVTGATNVFEGALVPVSVLGSHLPGGIVIKRSKLRGVESEGMLCAGEELGIGDDYYPGASVDGILIFQEEYAPGSDVLDIVGIKEPVIDFKITANRAADCMSMLGLAREASAILGAPLRTPSLEYTEAKGGAVGDYLRVDVCDYDLCPRYMARVVCNVKIAPSPLWMRQALAACGVRPINNIVDITNYVMLELGQPMHAFDHRNLRGQQIIVRRAGEGETLQTLDGKQRTLNPRNLVIADGEGPVALAGVMGGELSGIFEDTTTVVFESANFEWSSNRLTSRAQGMRTESSARYEKNLPLYLTEQALDRAMALVQQLGAGEVVPGVIDCRQAEIAPRLLTVSPARVCALLGQQISAQNISDILTRLGFGVKPAGDALELTVPLWRDDVETFADIAEEVQRLYGYDTIPSIAPPGEALMGRRTARQQDALKLRQLLSAMGLNEAMSYSFIAPSSLDRLGLAADDPLRAGVRLINPIGEDYSLMRPTLAPSMLKSLANNLNRKAQAVRLFEIAHTFRAKADAAPRNADGSYSLDTPCEEREWLCVGIADDSADFYDLKGIVETLLERFGAPEATTRAGGASWHHPGRSAEMWIGDARIAVLGELHPEVAQRFELSRRVLLAEVDVDALLALGNPDAPIVPLPKFPSVSRDLAVTVGRDAAVGDLLACIRSAGGPLLEAVELFDIYEGKQVAEGHKSVAFSLRLQAADHTLVDDEVTTVFNRVVAALKAAHDAELRA